MLKETISLPIPISEDGKELYRGGIGRIVFATKDTIFNNIMDKEEWVYFVNKKNIIFTDKIIGKIPKPFTNMVSSCRPKVVNYGGNYNITYLDYLSDKNYYTQIKSEPDKYKFGYVKCDDTFTGFIDGFTVEVYNIIEDNIEFYDIEITWSKFYAESPIFIPNLVEYCQENIIVN